MKSELTKILPLVILVLSLCIGTLCLMGCEHTHVEVIDPAVPATCTTPGKTEGKHCSECGEVLVAQEVTATIGHTWDTEWTVDKQPTCIEAGSQSFHCLRCEERTGSMPLSVIEHNFSGRWSIDKEATCIEEGSKSKHCSMCNIKGEFKIIPMTNHVLEENGHCKVCEYVKETESLVYTLNSEKNGYIVTGIENISETYINIPYYYYGKPVKEIGDSAFRNCKDIISITFPSSILKVGYNAFQGCSSLTSVYITDIKAWCNITYTNNYSRPFYWAENLYLSDQLVTELVIPDDVIEIVPYAFQNCKNISKITIGKKVEEIGECAFIDCKDLAEIVISENVKTINNSVFYGCNSLEKITVDSKNQYYYSVGNCIIETASRMLISGCKSSVIPTDVISIGTSAFEGIDSLIKMEIPNGVKSIGIDAFRNCGGLTNISIPKSVIDIGDNAFLLCINLERVTVEQGNNVYHSIDNCLIETATSTLILGCQNSVVPEGVKNIADYAFYGCRRLKQILIPDSVIRIGKYAFYNCTSLISIVIPKNVISIDDYAFRSCNKLVEVYNLSTLDVLKGDENHGYVGYYALDIYSSIGQKSKLHTTDEGYVFYENGNTVYLMGYIGKETQLALLERYHDKEYSIYDYAFNNSLDLSKVTIPKGVIGIGAYAFSECTSLVDVTIGNDITLIGVWAFHSCSNLLNVTMGRNVTNIGTYAFWMCGIEKINFSGTKEEWEAVIKGISWDKDTNNYIIYCIDGEIPKI